MRSGARWDIGAALVLAALLFTVGCKVDGQERAARRAAASYLGVAPSVLNLMANDSEGYGRVVCYDYPGRGRRQSLRVLVGANTILAGPLRPPWRPIDYVALGPGAVFSPERARRLGVAYITQVMARDLADYRTPEVWPREAPDPCRYTVTATRQHQGVPTASWVSVGIDAETEAVVDFGEVPLAVTGSPVPTVTAAAAQALAVRVKVPLMVGVDGYSGWDGRPLAAASPKLVYGFPSVDQPVPTPQRLMWRTVVCPASLVARLERQDKPERLELELDAHTGAVLYRYFLAAEPKEEPAGPRADRDWPAVAKQANGGRPFGAMLGVDPVSKCLSRCFAAGWLPGSDAKWERDVDRRARVSFAWQRGEVKALLVADVPDEGGGRLGLRLEGPSQGKDGTWLPLQPAGEALQWLQAMACEVLSPAVTAELLRPETRRRFHLQARERVLAGHGSVPWYEIETRGRRVQVFGAAGPASVVVRLEIEETLLEEALRQLDRAREPTR